MLKFAPLTSDIEVGFYTTLASHKINHDMLNDSARRLLGLYELRPNDDPDVSCRMQLHSNALTSDEVPTGFCRAEGMIRNVNTIEEYRTLDKAEILTRAGRTIWDAIDDGTIFSCPSLLASFTVTCFADLKKYKFTYHFGFPALVSEPHWIISAASNLSRGNGDVQNSTSAGSPQALTGAEATDLVESVQTWRYGVDARQYGFFLAKKAMTSPTIRPDEGIDDASSRHGNDERPMIPGTPDMDRGTNWTIGSLAKYEEGFFNGIPPADRYVCFHDPSTYLNHPGWMLRNLLILVRKRWKLDAVQVLCYRDTQARRDEARSIILNLEIITPNEQNAQERNGERLNTDVSAMPRITGWERNVAGKLANKIASLGEYMDPQRLADTAVDLNLKLMKWRIAPTLDLDIIKNSKCLLLGAGTLGSYVARNLLGWGVRKITFVDNGSVSYSNPVRQPLYEFKDCLNQGAKKAPRAAEALLEIYPGVDSKGYEMSVPMAGHPIMDEPKVKAEFETLRTLIDEHDVLFLLMDSRESRWLPTVMGKASGKIVMNAALGFDTFVVMRHGCNNPEYPADELGCYFCNDVVAPANSVADRTLDQQCTVTRPGIAAIASALLVEILVSLLQHPARNMAPAATGLSEDHSDHPLGIVPHQIRGFLATFSNMLIRGKSYDCCSACSTKVLDAYTAQGWEFVRRALNEKDYVEEISGLAEVQRSAEKAAADIEWDEEDETEEGDGELI